MEPSQTPRDTSRNVSEAIETERSGHNETYSHDNITEASHECDETRITSASSARRADRVTQMANEKLETIKKEADAKIGALEQ